MNIAKIKPESIFPEIFVKDRDGKEVTIIPPIANPEDTAMDGFYMVVVYRGKHCPICTKYLNEIQENKEKFDKLNTKIVAISTDSVEQLNEYFEESIREVSFPVYAELSTDTAKDLGLYLSEPTSNAETNHVFTEPALYLINPERKVQIIELSNAPFARPKLDYILMGINHITKNDYPIRGTL